MLHHLNRRKCEVVAQVDPERDPEHLQQQDKQEYARIDSDEPAHPARKWRQAQGHGFAVRRTNGLYVAVINSTRLCQSPLRRW